MTAIKFKIKKGDKVFVRTGQDKGKTGEVLNVLKSTNRVVVKGVNVRQKHTKASQAGPGGIIKKELSIHISNVAILDPKTNKPTRVGFKALKGDKKVRMAKKSGEVID